MMDDYYGHVEKLTDQRLLARGDIRLVSRARKRTLRKKGVLTWWSKELASYVRARIEEQDNE
jgi:hypothetical protein